MLDKTWRVFIVLKYSFEFKKKVVEAYFRGEGGYTFLAEKYGIKNRRQVLNWVHYYEEFGDDGLRRSRKNKKCSFEFFLIRRTNTKFEQ